MLEDCVFVSPGAVFGLSGGVAVGVTVRHGASIGARAVSLSRTWLTLPPPNRLSALGSRHVVDVHTVLAEATR